MTPATIGIDLGATHVRATLGCHHDGDREGVRDPGRLHR